MEEAQKYREQFLEIAGEIELNLSLILEDWKQFLQDNSSLDDLYRMVHSLKSGAAFLDLTGLEECSHRVEDGIESFRSGEQDGDYLKVLINEILDQLDIPFHDKPLLEHNFTPLEMTIMQEAEERGETIYRIACRIDPSEPMKKARAFLIQNNLELSFNVIKTVPSLRDGDDFSLFTLYLSTNEKRDALRRAMDVDRISEIRIDLFSPGEDDSKTDTEEILLVNQTTRRHPVSVERDRLEEIRVYLEDLRSHLGGDRHKLLTLTGGIDRVLKNILHEPLSTLGMGVDLYLKKLSERFRTNVTFTLIGGDLLLSMGQIQPLTEVFQQLVRNSLTHGIDRDGAITLEGRLEKGRKILRFSDNGRGLDREKINRLNTKGEEDTLHLLCQSGFTTSDKADTLSGRGIGLNLVKHNTEIMGGLLHMETGEGGKGLTFIIELPDEEIVPILQYRNGDRIATLPLYFVEEELELDRKKLKKNRKDRFFYLHGNDHLPLFEMSKPVTTLKSMRRASFIIIVSYLTKRYALLADELLLESGVPRSKLQNMLYIDPAVMEEGI